MWRMATSPAQRAQAPDIDSVVYVNADRPLHAGEFVTVKVGNYQGYDLVAEVAGKKGRALKVLA